MRRRPALLILCSLLFLFYPGMWTFHAVQGRPFFFGDFLFSVVLPLCLLVGLIRVTKVGWYTLIAFGFVWGARDLYVYYSNQGASLTPILLHLMVYVFSLSYFINPRVRHLYFDPKLHWWKTKHRYETHSPAIVRHDGRWYYPVMRNISEGGCFLELPPGPEVNGWVELAIPLPIPLNLSVIKAKGEIRWVSSDPLRGGVGVQFKGLPSEQLKAVKSFVRRQL